MQEGSATSAPWRSGDFDDQPTQPALGLCWPGAGRWLAAVVAVRWGHQRHSGRLGRSVRQPLHFDLETARRVALACERNFFFLFLRRRARLISWRSANWLLRDQQREIGYSWSTTCLGELSSQICIYTDSFCFPAGRMFCGIGAALVWLRELDLIWMRVDNGFLAFLVWSNNYCELIS